MIGRLFLLAVKLCLSASIVTGVVLLLRPFLKKAPRGLVCALWALVALRLVIPVLPQSKVSVIPEAVSGGKAVEALQSQVVEETLAVREDRDEVLYREITAKYKDLPVYQEAGQNYVVVSALAHTPPKTFGESVVPGLSVVWIIGIGIMLLYMFGSFWNLHRRLRTAVIREKGVWESDEIISPFILGVIRPRIYLPTSLSEEERAFVLAHEKTHLRRGDQIWKPLGYLLLAVYWFNPLFWLAYFLLCRDIEGACDERVIKNEDPAYRKAYSETLLKLNVRQKAVAACPLAFSENGVGGRIRSVLNYKKPAFWLIVTALVVSIVAAGCALTDPAKKSSGKESEESEDIATRLYETEQQIIDSFSKDNLGNPVYPGNFGGTYQLGLAQKVVVCLVDPDENKEKRYKEAVEDPSLITFKEVRHSYIELQAMQGLLKIESRKQGWPIFELGISVEANGLIVSTSEDHVQAVKNWILEKYPDVGLSVGSTAEFPAPDPRNALIQRTFVWQRTGFGGGDFAISFSEDGRFDYIEGPMLDYVFGTWTLSGNELTLETDKAFAATHYTFDVWQDELLFKADKSDHFTHVTVEDGDRFILSDTYIPVGELQPGAAVTPQSGKYHLVRDGQVLNDSLRFDFEKMTFYFDVWYASGREWYQGGMFIENGLLYAVDNSGYIPDGFVPDRADMEKRINDPQNARFIFRIVDGKTLEYVASGSDPLELNDRAFADKDILVLREEAIIGGLGDIARQKLEASFPFDEHSGGPIYPDDYAGNYPDGKDLVLCLKDPDEAMIRRYMELVAGFEDSVHIKAVSYSYNELEGMLRETADELLAEKVQVNLYGVDVENNGLNIGVSAPYVERVRALLQQKYPDVHSSVLAVGPISF